MLKIVEIIPILSIRRGAETFFVNLCEELKKRKDIELEVILLYDEIDKSFIEQFERSDIKPYFCHKHKGIDFKASKNLKKILEEIKPDVIHTHNCCLFTYIFAYGFKKQCWNYFHTCHSIPNVEATKLEHIFRKIYAKNNLMVNVAISKIIAEEFIKKYKLRNMEIVMNGTPLSNKKEASNNKEYDFICVGSLTEVKNHIFIIKCLQKMIENGSNLKLLCVGEGPLKETLMEYVKNHSLSDNINLIGSSNNVYELLSKAKVFLMPSINEGIPISILEAMDAGVPIIASNVGGIPNLISDNVNGILLQPNDEQRWIKSMKELLNDSVKMNNFVNYNFKNLSQYSIATCADNYLKVFKKYAKNS